jgi:hypothetical protein
VNAQQLAAHVQAHPEERQRFETTDAAFYAPFGPWQTLVEAKNRELRRAIALSQANAELRAMYALEAQEQP